MSESLGARLLAAIQKDKNAKITNLQRAYPSDRLGKKVNRAARGKRGIRKGLDG